MTMMRIFGGGGRSAEVDAGTGGTGAVPTEGGAGRGRRAVGGHGSIWALLMLWRCVQHSSAVFATAARITVGYGIRCKMQVPDFSR